MFKAIAAIAIATYLALGASPASACSTIFKAGQGVIDSCTGQPASPYRDLVTPTPTPQPSVVNVTVVTHVTVVNTVKVQAAPTTEIKANTCYPANGRSCPQPGDKWVYNSETGQIYLGTSVVPPYTDLPVLP